MKEITRQFGGAVIAVLVALVLFALAAGLAQGGKDSGLAQLSAAAMSGQENVLQKSGTAAFDQYWRYR